MKKKILSTLLAACLFVGIAIPSVMAATSDVAGDAKKVNKITMVDEKSEYDITVGPEGKEFCDLIAVYEDETKLVLDHNHIRYMLNGNVGTNYTGDFEINGSKVWARKVGATATLTIFDNFNASSKARVTVKLTGVAPTTSVSEWAESFTFKTTSADTVFTSPLGNSEGTTLSAQAHPSGSKFNVTDANYLAAVEATKKAIATALNLNNTVDGAVAGVDVDGVATVPAVPDTLAKRAVYTVDLNGMTAGTITSVFGQTVNVAFNNDATDTADDLVAVINNSPLGGNYTAAAATGVVTLTARAVGVDPRAATIKAGAVVGATNITVATVTEVTAGADLVKGTAEVPGTKGTITFDLSKANAKDAGTDLIIADSTITVKAAADTLDKQIAAWVVDYNAAGNDYTATYTAATKTLVLTEKIAGAHGPATSFEVETNLVATSAGTPAWMDITTSLSKTVVDGDTVNFIIPAKFLTAEKKAGLVAMNKANYVSINEKNLSKFMHNSGTANPNSTFSVSLNLNLVDAIKALSVRVADIEVMVGKRVEPTITYEPANANVGKGVTMTIRSDKNDGKPWQYAVLDGEVLGVNSAGLARLEVNLSGTTQNPGVANWATYAKVTVKPASFNTDKPYTSKISATTVETKVGQVTPLNITGMPAGVTVAWKYNDNGVMDLTNNNKASNAIIAKKVGTTNIVAELSNGETFKVAVTVAAADAKAPETDVPQTGDSFLKF